MKSDVRRLLLVVGFCSVIVGLAVATTLFERATDRSESSHSTSTVVSSRASVSINPGVSAGGWSFQQHVTALETASPYGNASSSAEFAGSDTCGQCHEAAVEHYSLTAMGQSLSRLEPGSFPPDAVIDDGLSPRTYRVIRRDGVMWHQELLSAAPAHFDQPSTVRDSEEILLSEHPVKWQIGSGHHTRSYLVEIDGFLIESPVTWYEARQAWGMSPGFDHPAQPGFGRIAETGCLYCHSGDARPMDGSSNRLTIHEAAIGCERCHGPGQRHVQQRSAEKEIPAGLAAASSNTAVDFSIVNPRHLDRELSDSVCGQCHLRSAATVLVPGARLDGFRPGLNLADFRTDYRFARLGESTGGTEHGNGEADPPSGDSMTVVGHIEQLRRSPCYQNPKLSCVTCHDPHQAVPPAERVRHFQSVCLQCHQGEDCRVTDSELQTRSPENDCTACHMPRSGTDIPHLTFTHHRIGVHPLQSAGRDIPRSKADDRRAGVLVPLSDSAAIPDRVKDAMLGLAYLEFSGRNEGAAHAEEYQDRAFNLLIEAWQQGERSPEVASALAALGADRRLPSFADAVRTGSQRRGITASMRVNFLLSEAFWNAESNRFSEAARLMQMVVPLRRVGTDWQLLGDFRQAAGNTEQTAEAFETALQISPMNPALRRWLIQYYARSSKQREADRHRKILSAIEEWSRRHGETR